MTQLSPNAGPRRNGLRPTLIVLHYTGMATGEAALARLCDPSAEVSAHYLIGENGDLIPLVPEELRAWHAGAGSWRGMDDINSRSIGIEIVNNGMSPFTEPQMAVLERLLPEVMGRWAIPPEGVIGHSDMAPLRKFDPGPRFDWRRLALHGLSVWPESRQPLPPHWPSFRRDLRAFGYPDVADEALLGAFRLRFRPWAAGPLSEAEMGMAQDLARSFAVDPRADSA